MINPIEKLIFQPTYPTTIEEEAYTALELVEQTATKTNELVDVTNAVVADNEVFKSYVIENNINEINDTKDTAVTTINNTKTAALDDMNLVKQETENIKTEMQGSLEDIASNTNRLNDIKTELTYSLADFVPQKNLLNINEFTNTGYLSIDGTIYTGDSYDSSKYSLEYTDVSEHVGETLYYSYNYNGTRIAKIMRVITAYDENKNVVSGAGKQHQSSYTIPEGIKYIRLTLYTTELTETKMPQLDYVGITEYEPYHNGYYALKESAVEGMVKNVVETAIAPMKEITDGITIVEENLVNPAEFVDGRYYWESSRANEDYFHTGKISVIGGEKIWISNSRFIYCFVGNTGRTELSDNIDHGTAYQYTTPDTVTDIIITTRMYHKSAFMVNRGVLPLPYMPYGEKNIKVNLDNSKGEIATSAIGDLKVFLPEKVYVAVGRTIELYNEQICLNKNVNFQWVSSIGKRLKRKLSITGTSANVGTYTVTLNLYNNVNDKIWIGTTQIIIYQPSITLTKKVVCIGDSWTNSKPWEAELICLENNLQLVGTKSFSVKDSTNTTRTGYHEGRSGWSAASYLGATEYTFESEGVHPFWDPTEERFNWTYYVTNSLAGNEPDAVVIMLGTNGLAYDNTTAVINEKQIVDYIRQDNATIPIIICAPAFWGNQNGLGIQTSNDGFASNTHMYELGQDAKIMDLQTRLADTFKDYTSLNIAYISICFDREYNYGAVVTPVNPRATQTELMPVEAVHPQAQGYYQTADIIYSALANLLEDGDTDG